MKIALAQIAPVWLNREATLEKIESQVEQAAAGGAKLVAFGEALLPGYPFWPDLTDGARFESDVQKEIYAHYAANAVDLENGGLDPLCRLAAKRGIVVLLDGREEGIHVHMEKRLHRTGSRGFWMSKSHTSGR